MMEMDSIDGYDMMVWDGHEPIAEPGPEQSDRRTTDITYNIGEAWSEP